MTPLVCTLALRLAALRCRKFLVVQVVVIGFWPTPRKSLDAQIASDFQIQPASGLKSQQFRMIGISVAIPTILTAISRGQILAVWIFQETQRGPEIHG